MIIIHVERKMDTSGDILWRWSKVKMLSEEEVALAYLKSAEERPALFQGIGNERCWLTTNRRIIKLYDEDNQMNHIRINAWYKESDFRRFLKIIRKSGDNLMRINKRLKEKRETASLSSFVVKI